MQAEAKQQINNWCQIVERPKKTMGRPPGKPNAPWFQIEQDFTSGVVKPDGSTHFPTLEELARQHGIPLSTLQKRSGRQKWGDRRAEHKRDLSAKRHAQRTTSFLNISLEMDWATMRMIMAAQKIVAGHLFIESDGKTRVNDKLSPLDLLHLVKALLAIVKTKQILMSNHPSTKGDDGLDLDGFRRSVEQIVIKGNSSAGGQKK